MKKKFDSILVHFFNDDFALFKAEIEKLSYTERERFWSYAATRLINRNDVIKLSKLIY